MLPYYLFCIKLVTVYRLTFAPVLFSPTVVSVQIFNGRITIKLEKLHNVHEKFTHGVPMFDVFFVWFICTSVDLTWFNYDIFFKISRKHPRLFFNFSMHDKISSVEYAQIVCNGCVTKLKQNNISSSKHSFYL